MPKTIAAAATTRLEPTAVPRTTAFFAAGTPVPVTCTAKACALTVSVTPANKVVVVLAFIATHVQSETPSLFAQSMR